MLFRSKAATLGARSDGMATESDAKNTFNSGGVLIASVDGAEVVAGVGAGGELVGGVLVGGIAGAAGAVTDPAP